MAGILTEISNAIGGPGAALVTGVSSSINSFISSVESIAPDVEKLSHDADSDASPLQIGIDAGKILGDLGVIVGAAIVLVNAPEELAIGGAAIGIDALIGGAQLRFLSSAFQILEDLVTGTSSTGTTAPTINPTGPGTIAPAPTPTPTPLPTPSQTGVYYLTDGGGTTIYSFNPANSEEAAYEIDPSSNVTLGPIQYVPGLGLLGIGHIAGTVGDTIFKLIPTTTLVADDTSGLNTSGLYGYHSYALNLEALSQIAPISGTPGIGALSTDSSGNLIGLYRPENSPIEIASIDPLTGTVTPIESLADNETDPEANSSGAGFADVNGTYYIAKPGEVVKYSSPTSSTVFQIGPIPGLPTGATTSGITNSDGTLVAFGAGVFAIDPNTGALTVINDIPPSGRESSDLFEGSVIDGTYVDAGATNLTTIVTTPTPVAGGFDGDQVRFDTYYPSIAPENLVATATTTVVPGTTTDLSSGGSSAGTPTSDMFRLDNGTDFISGNTITFLESTAAEGSTFASGAFNGNVITDLNPTAPVITGITLESTNIPGLTRDDFSFTDHSLSRNLQGLTLPSDVQASTVISIQFATTPTAAMLLMPQTG